MTAEISLRNTYYPWTKVEAGDIRYWVKGTLFYDNEPISNDDFISLFTSVTNSTKLCKKNLKKLASRLNGNFAIIVETSQYIFSIVDHIRSIPIFYSIIEGNLTVTDDANYIKHKIKPKLNEKSATEFLLTGYVTGTETLFEKINQLQTGEGLLYEKINKSLQIFRYFEYIHECDTDTTDENLLIELDKCLLDIFKRIIDSTIKKGKQIVVPLSGGLDSRLIVVMLKRLGVEKVIFFTYGNVSDTEVKLSRQVADKLNYKWIFIEYNKKKLYEFYNSKDMKWFYRYSSNLVSLPHIQDYLAIKELKHKNLIPKNSVFIPGHSGDFLAGSHIPHQFMNCPKDECTIEKAISHIKKKHYSLWDWKNDELDEFISTKILNFTTCTLTQANYNNCINLSEYFNFNERQSKYIINSIRVYEYMGYSWRLPLWDRKLTDLFLHVPETKLYNIDLYKKYVKEILIKQHFPTLYDTASTRDKRKIISSFIVGHIYVNKYWSRNFKNPIIGVLKLKLNGIKDTDKLDDGTIKNIINYNNEKIYKNITFLGFRTLEYLKYLQ